MQKLYNFKFHKNKILVLIQLNQIFQSNRDDWAKWTDESSGAYTKYVSIDEEGTSSRVH